MGQILIRNLPDEVVESFRMKAKLSGHSLEQTLRDLIIASAPYSAEECVTVSDRFQSTFANPVPSLSRDDMRDGLE